MKKTITRQLGVIIVSAIFVSMLITSISNYWVSYKKTYEAAGIEAVGCANITTGLIKPSDIEEILNGNKEKQLELHNTLNWTTDHKQIFESQYILSLDGTILVADSNLEEQGFKAGDSFYIDKEAIEMIQETKHPHYSSIYEFGGMKRLTGYAPIFKDHDPNKEIVAINAIDFDAAIVSERTWESVKGGFILGLLPMAIACLFTILLIRRKTKPIETLIDYAKKISEGDLSIENVKIKANNEIGDLADTLNIMAHNLRELIQQFSSNSERVAAFSTELSASAEQNNYATEQITLSTQELATSVDKQVNSVEEVSQTVNEMSIGIQQISNNAKSVSTTAYKASEKASEGGQAIQIAVQQMQSITTTVNGLAEQVKELGDQSKEIGQIIEVITGISAQTNLLALNAAIEAARAGEHGRGFAIVADEVRKLAEQSSSSAQQISQLISTIQVKTTKAVQAMEVATKEVTEGIGVVNTAGESFVQIQETVNEVSTEIQEVSSAVQQMASGADSIVESMQLITEVAVTAASSTKQVSHSTEEQLASMEEISISVTDLAKMAEELKMNIGKFKL